MGNDESTRGNLVSDDDLGTEIVDADRLQGLFENLFRNAFEHGGAVVILTVGRFGNGFFVSDDGPGFPENEGDDIFEHGYSTRSAGTGLRCGIVERIVEAHRWRVRVTHSDSGGARFGIVDVD